MAHRGQGHGHNLDRVRTLVDQALDGRISRRQIVTRAATLGLAAPLAAAIADVRPRRTFAQGGQLNLASYSSDPAPREYTEQTLVPGFEAATGIDVELNTVNHEDFKQAIRTKPRQSPRARGGEHRWPISPNAGTHDCHRGPSENTASGGVLHGDSENR
ncbi:MAG TPA: hypothetical protein VMQ81_06785 [Acidimicrobiia bacterium]|nr:hypothetical protein [Acidimicrobiia bacterium]